MRPISAILTGLPRTVIGLVLLLCLAAATARPAHAATASVTNTEFLLSTVRGVEDVLNYRAYASWSTPTVFAREYVYHKRKYYDSQGRQIGSPRWDIAFASNTYASPLDAYRGVLFMGLDTAIGGAPGSAVTCVRCYEIHLDVVDMFTNQVVASDTKVSEPQNVSL